MVEGYLESLALLIDLQRHPAPELLLANQRGIAERNRDRLLDCISKKEIIVSSQGLINYLLQRSINLYRKVEVEAGKAEAELAQNPPEDAFGYIAPMYPIMKAEGYKALVEAALREPITIL